MSLPITQTGSEISWSVLSSTFARALHPKTGRFKPCPIAPFEDWLKGMSDDELTATRLSLANLSHEGVRLFRAMEEVFLEAPESVFQFVVNHVEDKENVESPPMEIIGDSTAAIGKPIDELDPAAPSPISISWAAQFAAINDSLPELRKRLERQDHKKIGSPFCEVLRAILDLVESGVDMDFGQGPTSIMILDLASVAATNRHAARLVNKEPSSTAEGTLFAWLTLDRILADRCKVNSTPHQIFVAKRREVLEDYWKRVGDEPNQKRRLRLLSECDRKLISLAATH